MASLIDTPAEIIEYCIRSSYLTRADLLSCQDDDGKLNLEKCKQKELPGELKTKIEEEIGRRKEQWKGREEGSTQEKKLKKYVIFNDSVHKSIELNSLEVAIVDTKQFSRMRNIKQLGGASYVYPGAVHTRFEHSIGVCHLAGVFVDKLKKKMERYKNNGSLIDFEDHKKKFEMDEKEEQCIRIAALCHDLGHGPYSHMFEGFRKKILEEGEKIIAHEEISILIFKHILSTNMKVLSEFVASGLSWEDVWKIEFMIHPDMKKIKSPKKFLFEIVANKSSGLDVDKWDYYARDCHYLGISNEYDYGRTMELSNIVLVGEDCHIGFRRKEVDNIYRMFRTRTVLYQKAYAHKVVDAVQMMITDALVHVKDAQIIPSWKNSLKDVLRDFTTAPSMELRRIDKYIDLTDNIVAIIKMADANEGDEETKNIEEAQEILNNLDTRELLKCYTEVVIPSSTIGEMNLHKGENLGKWMKEKRPDLEKATEFTDLEIKISKISYASEASANPVKEIYFFDDKDLPTGKQIFKTEESTNNKKEPVSLLNTPHTFLEYRVRAYGKRQRHDEKELDKYLTKKIRKVWNQ